VGASIEGELHLVMDVIVSYPIQCLLFFVLLIFLFKRTTGGHYPGVVTSGGNITHNHLTEMRRMAHDVTPFLLSMPPIATTMVWLPNIW
jgi:hypothetical protein